MQTYFPAHTHTQVCQSNETGMLRCRQIYKPFSLSLSLSPLDGIGFLSCRHCLSAEALKCHMARWLDSERPAGRRERRWDDGLVKPVCKPLLCAGRVADSSVRGPQCCLLCQLLWESGSTPQHFFPHNNLCLHRSNTALTSLLLLTPCSHFPQIVFIFSYSVSIFHSICPSHLHTELSREWIPHPCPPPNVTLKLTYLWGESKSMLMKSFVYSFQLWHRPGLCNKTTGLVPLCLRLNLWVFSQCVCSSETEKERLEWQGYREGARRQRSRNTMEKQSDRKWPPREGASPGVVFLFVSHTQTFTHTRSYNAWQWCLPTDMHENEANRGARLGLLRCVRNARS